MKEFEIYESTGDEYKFRTAMLTDRQYLYIDEAGSRFCKWNREENWIELPVEICESPTKLFLEKRITGKWIENGVIKKEKTETLKKESLCCKVKFRRTPFHSNCREIILQKNETVSFRWEDERIGLGPDRWETSSPKENPASVFIRFIHEQYVIHEEGAICPLDLLKERQTLSLITSEETNRDGKYRIVAINEMKGLDILQYSGIDSVSVNGRNVLVHLKHRDALSGYFNEIDNTVHVLTSVHSDGECGCKEEGYTVFRCDFQRGFVKAREIDAENPMFDANVIQLVKLLERK